MNPVLMKQLSILTFLLLLQARVDARLVGIRAKKAREAAENAENAKTKGK